MKKSQLPKDEFESVGEIRDTLDVQLLQLLVSVIYVLCQFQTFRLQKTC